MREETEEEENQTVLSMTELQYYSSSEEEGLSDKGEENYQTLDLNNYILMVDLEWPVGVTPDIKTVKARISRQHQLSRDTTAQPLKASITSVPDSEASWLHVGSDGKIWYCTGTVIATLCSR